MMSSVISLEFCAQRVNILSSSPKGWGPEVCHWYLVEWGRWEGGREVVAEVLVS